MTALQYQNQKNCLVTYDDNPEIGTSFYEEAITMEMAEAIFEKCIDKLPIIHLSPNGKKQNIGEYLLTWGAEEVYYLFFDNIETAREYFAANNDNEPMLYFVNENILKLETI